MLKQNAVFTDEELMDRIRNCDCKCFEELYDRYHKRLFNFIFRIVNDREKAEDFLHDVFIKVMESHDRFDMTRKFSTWIYTIAINLCRNEMRNQLNRKQLIALNFIPDFISPAIQNENIDKRNFKHELNKLIGEMDEENKTILLLRFHEELSISQISSIVGLAEGTVKSRLFYMLKKMANQLSVYNPTN